MCLNGNLRVNGEVHFNDSVSFFKSGDVSWKGQQFRHLTQFRVGSGYTFQSIQDCINYIEMTQEYKQHTVCVEVYPSKVYCENIVISCPNIRLVGKLGGATIQGDLVIKTNASDGVDAHDDNHLFMSNLIFRIPEYHSMSIVHAGAVHLKTVTIHVDSRPVFLHAKPTVHQCE